MQNHTSAIPCIILTAMSRPADDLAAIGQRRLKKDDNPMDRPITTRQPNISQARPPSKFEKMYP